MANTARAWFGQSSDRVVRAEDAAGRGVTVGLPDAAKGELSLPRVDGDTVTHEDVAALDGADLSYEVLPGRVKESIILAEAPDEDAGPVEYVFTLSDLDGLTPRLEKDGSIGFYGELEPEPAVSIPAGVMWDSREAETTEGGKLSAPDDQGAAVSRDVAYELERSGNGAWTLTVTPDLDWLTDEARVWPVTVDPTIIISPTGNFSKDTMILSEAPTTEYYTSSRLSVGRTGGGLARAMLEFPQLDDVVPAGSTVTDADLGLYFDQAHTDWATEVPPYAQAHGAFGTEMAEFGARSLVSVTTSRETAEYFAGEGGEVFVGQVARSELIEQTLEGAAEAESLIRNAFGAVAV
ncbi:hypothetical protein [Promicromonospora umidemergens]|uniref:hypothetical protein n=1 Tax=Promicromonospora umidemergens TaxID=629679 RepID=UPI0020A6075F|nr:hypothetical protein [Promicromonospora umidemergens]